MGTVSSRDHSRKGTVAAAAVVGRMAALLALLAVTAVSGVALAEETATNETGSKEPGAKDGSLQELFQRLDANQDSQLAPDEVSADKERLFKRLLRKADANQDGRLSRDEFAAGLASAPNSDPQTPSARKESDETPRGPLSLPPEAFFRRMDANGDGRVTTDEIPAERRENFSRLLERADANGDGAMTREEFEKVRQRLGAGPPAAATASRGAARPKDGTDSNDSPASALLVALDLDRDGKLSADELAKAAQSLAKLDKDGNGELSPAEMRPAPAATTLAKGPGPDPARIWKRLLSNDKDGDGKLSPEEAPERMQRNFERIDANGDGQVDESEFKASVAALARLRGAPEKTE